MWEEIKTEYITTQVSYKKLAEKYGLNPGTVATRGRFEHWGEQRREHLQKIVEKSVDKIGDQQAENLARVDALADQLLDKLGKAIDQLDMTVVRHKEKEKTEEKETLIEYEEFKPGGVVDRKALRQLAASLKDLKQIKALQSELDKLEQEARIQRLWQQMEQEDGGGVTVSLEGDIRDFAQ